MILNLHHVSRAPERLTAFAPLTHLGTQQATMHRAASSIMAGLPLTLYEVAFDAGQSLRMPDLNDRVRGNNHSWIRMADVLHYDVKQITAADRESIFKAAGSLPEGNDQAALARLVEVLNAQGFDSIVYTNVFEHPGADSFIVLNPSRARILATRPRAAQSQDERKILLDIIAVHDLPLIPPRKVWP